MKIPKEWTFKDAGVAAGFDAHVREQLPWYEMATQAVAHVVRHYLPPGGVIYDIGASTGNIGRAVAGVLHERSARLVAIEESAEMAAKYEGPGVVVNRRAQDMVFEPFDVAVLFLTVMFLPVGDRAHLIKCLRMSLRKGGVIIIFDKVTPPPGYIGTVLRRLTMSWKLNNGAKAEDIVAKELSLSGVQRPVNPGTLFPDATQFFLFGEFAGWLIEANE